MNLNLLADQSAGNLLKAYIAPSVTVLALIASVVCSLLLIIAGYHYIASSGDPRKLEQAKKVIKNALIGLVIVLSAAFLINLLSHAYGPTNTSGVVTSIPSLNAIKPQSASSGILGVIIKTLSGVLGNIIETVAVPFLKALTYFTSGTPLIASNPSVFNLWLSVVGMADALFVLVIILLGFHVMTFSSLGMDELNIKQLLPQIGLVFLLINSSVFVIDGVISLSNFMIKAISNNQSASSVWQVLSEIVKQSSGFSLAALIIMIIFLVFSVILLVYYVGRIVTLYLGAVLAPLIILCWLMPSVRDFAITATKRYVSTIFVLFVHVVILLLASSLLTGVVTSNGSKPDPLMSMIVGLATLVALLKTQGVMAQLSYAAIGPRSARRIAERLVLNLSYLGGQGAQMIGNVFPSTQIPGNMRYKESAYNPSPRVSSKRASSEKTSPSNKPAPKATTSNKPTPKVNSRGYHKP
jgi:hypothetical protein